MEKIDYLIAGCGVSGRAAARLASFLKLDYAVLDENDTPEISAFLDSLAYPPRARFTGFRPNVETLPARFAVAVLSPGIRRSNPLFAVLKNASDSVCGELEFSASLVHFPIVGITGTNGKTTTTELTAALFRAIGVRAEACGNIGSGLGDTAIAFRQGKLDLAVAEISSFQMENADAFPTEAAAVLNLASDHLDRHGGMDAYAQLKFKLANSAKKAVILNANLDRKRAKFLHSSAPVITFSAVRNDADLTLGPDDFIRWRGRQVFPFSRAKIAGRHNAENMMAALAFLLVERGEDAIFLPAVAETLEKFTASGHRVEKFLEQNGVLFVDDSKATNPHAVNAALDLFGPEKRVRLLLGGQDKGMCFEELLPHLGCVKKVYLTGACAPALAAALEGHCELVRPGSFADTVRAMCADASGNDVVLLSPATASFDHFHSYAERGDEFQKLVRAVMKA